MNDQNILDEDLTENRIDIWEAIEWWESKRKTYNFILVAMSAFIIFAFFDNFGSLTFGLFWAIVFSLAANACFIIGWGIEALAAYYFKRNLAYYRKIFWICGILLTLFMTASFGEFIYFSDTPYLY